MGDRENLSARETNDPNETTAGDPHAPITRTRDGTKDRLDVAATIGGTPPLPVGASTEAKQDSQITLATTLNTLTTTANALLTTIDAVLDQIELNTDDLVKRTNATAIGNVSDSLKVSATLPDGEMLSFSSKYRNVYDETGLTLTGAFQTVFTYSGSGLFVGFVLQFNKSNPRVRVTIDGEEIFSLASTNLSDVGWDSMEETAGGPRWASSRMIFHPQDPIAFSSTVLVEALRETSNPNLLRYIYTMTQET